MCTQAQTHTHTHTHDTYTYTHTYTHQQHGSYNARQTRTSRWCALVRAGAAWGRRGEHTQRHHVVVRSCVVSDQTWPRPGPRCGTPCCWFALTHSLTSCSPICVYVPHTMRPQSKTLLKLFLHHTPTLLFLHASADTILTVRYPRSMCA
jgi:hypothetical protein